MKLKYAAFILSLIISSSALAQDRDRNVAGKLTSYKKPRVLVMTEEQQKVAAMNSLALNLDADPNEIICRKERVGRAGSSRLKVHRCHTRAEIRERSERMQARNSRDADDNKRRMSTARSAGQLMDRRSESRARRGLGN